MDMSARCMRQVKVKLGRDSYKIHIGPGVRFASRLADMVAGRNTLVVTDSNVEKTGHLERICEICSSASELGVAVLKPGEKVKTLEAVGGICSFAAKHNFDRKACFVALAGGVAGDMTGFASGIYKRGIGFIQVPTTLLAMVDSSVGGKTGVDLPEGKNLAGLFHQPEAVFIDPAYLATLPRREWRNGLAEIIKYGAICDRGLFDFLWDNRNKLLKEPDGDFYAGIIEKCCAIKAAVVAEDERETGRRAILNFGHTFGHAIELLSNFKVPHGMAVGCGMAMAGRLAVRLGMMRGEDQIELGALLDFVGLPLRVPFEFDPAEVLAAMRGDKKAEAGKIRLILPTAIGSVEMVDSVGEKDLLAFLEAEL